MVLKNKFNLIIVALLLVFGGLATYCYATEIEECDFSSTCPYFVPPCYSLVFDGIRQCEDDELVEYNNEILRLKYRGEGDPECYHSPAPDCNCVWHDDGPGLKPPVAGYWGWIQTYPGGVRVRDGDGEGFNADGPHPSGVDIGNERGCNPGGGYGGTATYEPVWDCKWCGNCDNLTIEVYKEPAYYPNKNCCPVPPFGKSIVRMKCNAAEYVIPECEIEGRDPNGNWVAVASSPVVTVFSVPNGCSAANKVTFHITTFPATPPLDPEVRVRCTGMFWDVNKQTKSRTVYVYPEPGCTPCCEGGCAPGTGPGAISGPGAAACVPVASGCPPAVILPPPRGR